MRIYPYLRASTHDQDEQRAKKSLTKFVKDAGQDAAAWFFENESGATLKRPELFRLLDIAQSGDVLLVEQVDRISRLNASDWEKLKSIITSKGIRIVALDLPTSHQFMKVKSDDFTGRVFSAINSMMLDMLAAVARKDYEDRRRRQSEGIEKARSEGKYKGRQINRKLHENIAALLAAGKSYSDIVKILGCSKSTISQVKKRAMPVTEEGFQTTKILMSLVVENNSKFVRGKATSLKHIELYCLPDYKAKKLKSGTWDYELTFKHKDDEDLKKQIYELANAMEDVADLRNGFTESEFFDPITEKIW